MPRSKQDIKFYGIVVSGNISVTETDCPSPRLFIGHLHYFCLCFYTLNKIVALLQLLMKVIGKSESGRCHNISSQHLLYPFIKGIEDVFISNWGSHKTYKIHLTDWIYTHILKQVWSPLLLCRTNTV